MIGAINGSRGHRAWHDSFLVRSLREDAATAWRDLLVNTVAGAFWMPRIGRFVLYRLAGLRIRTPDVYCGCTLGRPSRSRSAP